MLLVNCINLRNVVKEQKSLKNRLILNYESFLEIRGTLCWIKISFIQLKRFKKGLVLYHRVEIGKMSLQSYGQMIGRIDILLLISVLTLIHNHAQ